MKLKIDENLATSHRELLRAAGFDTTDVHEEGLAGASDSELWAEVCNEGRLLVTLDHDFSDVRRFVPGTHPGLLLLRTNHPSRGGVERILRRILAENVLDTLSGCLAVADEVRTRIRRGY